MPGQTETIKSREPDSLIQLFTNIFHAFEDEVLEST